MHVHNCQSPSWGPRRHRYPLQTHIYLLFYLLHGVCEEDGGGGIRRTHLGLRTLQSWEEGGVKQGWLVEAETRSNVSRHAEIGILEDIQANKLT